MTTESKAVATVAWPGLLSGSYRPDSQGRTFGVAAAGIYRLDGLQGLTAEYHIDCNFKLSLQFVVRTSVLGQNSHYGERYGILKLYNNIWLNFMHVKCIPEWHRCTNGSATSILRRL